MYIDIHTNVNGLQRSHDNNLDLVLDSVPSLHPLTQGILNDVLKVPKTMRHALHDHGQHQLICVSTFTTIRTEIAIEGELRSLR